MVATIDNVTGVRTTPAGEADAAEWNAFVRASTEASFCHLWEWADFFRDCFGHEPKYLMARDEDGRVEGVLPLVRMPSLSGHHLISMPYLNYGGPIGSARACAELTLRARSEIGPGRTKRLELRSRTEQHSALPVSRAKVTVVLPLPETVEALWKETFRAKLRSQIRRAKKEPMEVVFGPELIDEFYGVFSRNMRDLGTPVLPRRFFHALAVSFASEVVFGVVRYEGIAVAAGCGFVWNGEFEMTWASSLREYNGKAPNMLLYASFMEEMIRRGMHSFNFGRCTPGEGTHRFKLQWGGSDEPLHWTGWPAEVGHSGPGDALRQASRVWQKLPLSVAELIGPAIAKRLPQF